MVVKNRHSGLYAATVIGPRNLTVGQFVVGVDSHAYSGVAKVNYNSRRVLIGL